MTFYIFVATFFFISIWWGQAAPQHANAFPMKSEDTSRGWDSGRICNIRSSTLRLGHEICLLSKSSDRLWAPRSGHRCPFLDVKRPEHKAHHSHLSNAEAMKEWSYTATPPICLRSCDRHKVTSVMNCCSVELQLLQLCQIPTTWKHLGKQRSIHSTLGIIRCLRNKLYGHQEVCAILYVHVTVHLDKFLFNKTNRRTNFPNLFCQ